MMLYLCQHGEALTREVDPERPLSEKGATDICNVANALGDVIQVDTFLHSGKTRARQSAELLHERLAPDATIEAVPGLAPKDSAADFAATLDLRQASLMVVGHMPFLGGLASRLLGENDRNIVAFQPGAVAALDRDEGGRWMMAWMLSPTLVSA